MIAEILVRHIREPIDRETLTFSFVTKAVIGALPEINGVVWFLVSINRSIDFLLPFLLSLLLVIFHARYYLERDIEEVSALSLRYRLRLYVACGLSIAFSLFGMLDAAVSAAMVTFGYTQDVVVASLVTLLAFFFILLCMLFCMIDCGERIEL